MVQPTCLAIEVDAGAGAGAEELDQLTMQLWRELSELDLDSVERAGQGVAPAGARAADVLALGARGAGAVTHFLLGSVAEAALKQAPVEVLIVK